MDYDRDAVAARDKDPSIAWRRCALPCKPVRKRCKKITESVILAFDLTDFCANRWSARQYYSLDETVRPSEAKETGFQFTITTAGQTGKSEPNWNQATVTDGSAVWAREPITNDSLSRTITDVEWDGDGLTIADAEEVTTNGEQQIYALASVGTAGKHYPNAHVTFSDGQERDYFEEITVNV